MYYTRDNKLNTLPVNSTGKRHQLPWNIVQNWMAGINIQKTDQSSPYRDEESLRFLHCFANRDPTARSQAFDFICRNIDAWLDGYGSPKDATSSDIHSNGIGDFRPLIEEHAVDILRISLRCPFSDVRENCLSILADLQVKNMFNAYSNYTQILNHLYFIMEYSVSISICALEWHIPFL